MGPDVRTVTPLTVMRVVEYVAGREWIVVPVPDGRDMLVGEMPDTELDGVVLCTVPPEAEVGAEVAGTEGAADGGVLPVVPVLDGGGLPGDMDVETVVEPAEAEAVTEPPWADTETEVGDVTVVDPVTAAVTPPPDEDVVAAETDPTGELAETPADVPPDAVAVPAPALPTGVCTETPTPGPSARACPAPERAARAPRASPIPASAQRCDVRTEVSARLGELPDRMSPTSRLSANNVDGMVRPLSVGYRTSCPLFPCHSFLDGNAKTKGSLPGEPKVTKHQSRSPAWEYEPEQSPTSAAAGPSVGRGMTCEDCAPGTLFCSAPLALLEDRDGHGDSRMGGANP